MSSSTVSNPSSSVASTGGSSTPWGWIVWKDPQSKTAIPLRSGNANTVGRHLENHVVVPTSLVDASLFQRISRNHCTLEKSLENGEISLISHSGNGTYVDGQRVLNQKVFRVYHGAVIALCSAASRASFTLYDNFHRHFDQQYFQLRNNYLFMSVMAGGAFGQVSRAIKKDDCTVVALKTAHAANQGSSQSAAFADQCGISALRHEIDILSTTNHPCIVKMLDSSVDRTTNSAYLVMELACGGDLQNKLFAVGHLSEQTAKYFFIQMVSAIKYCHDRSPPIAHRDLSPANILLTDDSDFAGVKITDFGLAKRVTCPSSLTTYCGTELYIAPEVRSQKDDDDADPYTPAVDIWSLGVVLHYVLFGRHPACARANHTGLSTSTERSNDSTNAPGATVSEAARSLIDGMLAIDVGLRYSLEDVIGCQWLRDEDTMAQLRERVFKETPIF